MLYYSITYCYLHTKIWYRTMSCYITPTFTTGWSWAASAIIMNRHDDEHDHTTTTTTNNNNNNNTNNDNTTNDHYNVNNSRNSNSNITNHNDNDTMGGLSSAPQGDHDQYDNYIIQHMILTCIHYLIT